MHVSSTRNVDVIVIGAGAAGLSAAWQCARLGAKSVTVLEKAHFAQASSGLSAGIFNRQTADSADLRTRIASVEILSYLEARNLMTLNRSGYVRLLRTQEQLDQTREAVRSSGSSHSAVLDSKDVAELVPGMWTEDVFGGMYGAQDGHMDGSDLCRAYLQAGRMCGVTYRSRTPVLGSRKRNGRHALKTPAGVIEADVIINAAGSWLSRVGAMIGTSVPIDNQRHQICLVRVPSLMGMSLPIVQTYFPGSGENSVYVRPEGPGKFIAGLHSYESHSASENPDTYGRGVDADYIDRLAESLIQRFPGWEDASLEAGWTGLYPSSPDGRWIIGPHAEDPSVISVGGLGGVGLTVSPAVGLVAAEWAVLEEVSALPPDLVESFKPSRFADAQVDA